MEILLLTSSADKDQDGTPKQMGVAVSIIAEVTRVFTGGKNAAWVESGSVVKLTTGTLLPVTNLLADIVEAS